MRPRTQATFAPCDSAARRARRVHRALWTVRAGLAALFLFGGGSKLVMPSAMLAALVGYGRGRPGLAPADHRGSAVHRSA